MKIDLSKVLLNPVRMRIVQVAMMRKRVTASQISEQLTDVPKPSLYRHIRTLEEANILIIVEETPIRGAIEKTYSYNYENPYGEYSNENGKGLIIHTLLALISDFDQYFKGHTADIKNDMLFLSTATLMLSDQEYEQVMTEIKTVLEEVVENPSSEERKPRRITIVSSPTEEEKE